MCSRPGGVDEHQVGAAARGGAHGVEHDRARVGALLAPDELGADATGPVAQLLGGGGAERVGGGQHELVAVVGLALRDLGDGRGLARRR